MSDYTVDVIIPVYKPGRKLKQLLTGLQKQTKPIHRIILIQTLEVGQKPLWENKKKNMEIHTIQKEDFDHGGTRNLGASLSEADYLVYMTQDAVPRDEYLIENLIASLEDSSVAVAYGRQFPNEDANPIEVFTRQFNYPETSLVKDERDVDKLGIKAYFSSNVCAAYNRNTFMKLGGFEEKALFSEDTLFAAKAITAGYKVVYAAEAGVNHSHNLSLTESFKRNFDIGATHGMFPEVFGHVRSESEGLKLVKETAKYLVKEKKLMLIPNLFLLSGGKYLGYRFGKSYQHLPKVWIQKMSLNPKYWVKE
ncbi:rhamnosyltransferase [Aequitasia blattaphilus]|uniref:Glycosyltransferase family 2 protein n=1 Tax=Aequitasia blattaphilus TaxID=2949332 RepID=A0ABT1E8N8_9FIRM|nr:glycosyltransferase family 2 protein [Aequitasia blattaphilus]MCP1101357.1 glycosyltransferase family 2 protein [Aequitasia blattaphilus]MCR8613997.1 glycosyltransferase family 2 protein [Aequitasia blattaphilus]